MLAHPGSTTSWAIVKLGSEGAILCARGAAAPIHIDGLKVRLFSFHRPLNGKPSGCQSYVVCYASASAKAQEGGVCMCVHCIALFLIIADGILMQVPVTDTVGCGDSFAAAIALGYTRGRSTDATLALANAVGAATAMSRGVLLLIRRATCQVFSNDVWTAGLNIEGYLTAALNQMMFQATDLADSLDHESKRCPLQARAVEWLRQTQ